MALRRAQQQGDGGGNWPYTDGHAANRLPDLADFLSCESWDKDTQRVTGSISIFVEGGALKCCLSDRDQHQVCFLTADTLEDLLGLANDAVAGSPNADWRKMKGHYRSKNGK